MCQMASRSAESGFIADTEMKNLHISGQPDYRLSNLNRTLAAVACTTKHRGFSEERGVRLVGDERSFWALGKRCTIRHRFDFRSTQRFSFMPQFIRNGPDIPERLLQEHEDGRVVFFCGAGVSYPASLPGFGGLVTRLFHALSVTPSPVQQSAIKAGQFDTAIGLLESDIVGGREIVRRALARILQPNLGAPNALATHDALLTLSKNRNGSTRIITTNFDRLFEEVIGSKALSIARFQAPLLPVPKKRWDGLVYLHGLLSVAPTANELDCLVASSGDFGLAYLTERWAARFVSELFRNYTVCFVGYSINDPVMRYMMDALSADRLLGESPPEVYAFGSYAKGKETQRELEWRAKNVTPILYREHSHHAYLHRTLREWARTYHDGVSGKERIVTLSAASRPMASTVQDDFVGRVLWALSDPGGAPAKRFAELDPVPSLDWLLPFSDDRYLHRDLIRFGVPPLASVDDKLKFSLVQRPAPYPLAPVMALSDLGARGTSWDSVMFQLARWMLRHLNDPKLILWLVKRGGQLHPDLVHQIERRLNELAKLERDGSSIELARIRESAPNAIPDELMRTLWGVLLSDGVHSWTKANDLYRWTQRLERDGLTASARLELQRFLRPCVTFREPYRWHNDDGDQQGPRRISDLVGWDIVLAAHHVHYAIQEVAESAKWADILPDLLSDFTSLLRDALDLMRELGGADDKSDRSYIARPSISEHSQNRDSDEWTALIDLTRDAWLMTAAQSEARAALAVEAWSYVSYPLFRRLTFFAAAHGDIVPRRRALDWLLSEDGWWLWSVETQREVMRLLVALPSTLDEPMRNELEEAVLRGPPRGMFKEDIEPERWTRLAHREVWRRLAKIGSSVGSLGPLGKQRLAGISQLYPEWSLEADDRDEFPFWMGTGDELSKFNPTPQRRRELMAWLKSYPSTDPWQEDDWRKRCSEDFPTTACALYGLAMEQSWPVDRWREALQAWSEEKLQALSWRHMARVVEKLPDDVLQSLSHGVAWWLQGIAKTFEGQTETFFRLVRGVLAREFEEVGDAGSGDPVTRAINHPVGLVTEAMLRWWYRSSLKDGQGLPAEIKTMLTGICDGDTVKFRHGRVLLSAHLIALFRVDRDWTQEWFLPHFDWQRSAGEARAVWEGFLWTPRLYRPLMEALKPAFLITSRHYAELGDHKGQYASLLTFAALDRGDTFSLKELADATRGLPADGLQEVASTLRRALEGAGEQRSDYWTNRIVPYFNSIWPKSRDNVSPGIAEAFGRLCIAAVDRFPEALALLGPWLQSPSNQDFLVHQLSRADLSKSFPDDALEFLNRVIVSSLWAPSELDSCLKAIAEASPRLTHDVRFQRLSAVTRR
jgi:hypothetical protein